LSAGFFAFTLAVCGLLLASRLRRAPRAAERANYVATLNAAVPSAAFAPGVSANPARAATEPAPAGSNALNEPAQAAPPSIATASAAPNAANAANAAVAAAPAASARLPSRQEVVAAVRATPVLMFSASWCPVCARARRFFQSNGIQVVDRDVDADATANAELKRRSGGKAIPLIEVDGQQLRAGFSEQDTMQAVASSVERRLGVTGLRLVPAAAPK
jgi:glutaredoxin